MTFFFARRFVRFASANDAARRSRLALGAVLAASTLLAGCSTYDSTTHRIANAITPYRIDIVQGNFVSREQAAQLKEGMTRDQVRYVLGTPLLTDMFHGNRWDYVFSFKRGNADVVQERKLTVWFDGDRLTKWAGAEELPSEVELIAEIDGIKRPKKEAAEAAAAAGAAPAARAPSIPSAEVGERVQSTAGSKNAVGVPLPERPTGGGSTDTSVPPPATTSP